MPSEVGTKAVRAEGDPKVPKKKQKQEISARPYGRAVRGWRFPTKRAIDRS